MIVGQALTMYIFEVRLNDDSSNPECIKSLDKVCLALTIFFYYQSDSLKLEKWAYLSMFIISVNRGPASGW